ncbi:hypothetical protein GW17_00025339, partial [Ensete ventricosum]
VNMADRKHGANFNDDDPITKRFKGTDVDTSVESKSVNADCSVSVINQSVSDEMNGKKESNFDDKLSKDCKNFCLTDNSSEDTSSCTSADTPHQVSMVTCIEADAAEDKGSRHTMEDASVVLLDASLESPGKLRYLTVMFSSSCAHFAVYDGHGGRLAAEYAQRHLHANVLAAGLPREWISRQPKRLYLKTKIRNLVPYRHINQLRYGTYQAVSSIQAHDTLRFRAILSVSVLYRTGFRRTDELLLQESVKGNWQDGATAVCVWVLGETVLVANIGDAKAVLARLPGVEGSQTLSDERGSPLKAIVVTREHKAIYPQERARIQKLSDARFALPSDKAPYRALRTNPPTDRYANRSLSGGTAEIDRRRSIEGEKRNIRGRGRRR